MIECGYEFGKIFQRRLLAALLRNPAEFATIVRPQFFTSPIMVDIARIIIETYRNHPNDRLTRVSILELIKPILGRNRADNLPIYKEQLKKLFEVKRNLPDTSIMSEQATRFAREAAYRGALVRSERFISTGNYEAVHETIDKLRSFGVLDGSRPSKWGNLPRCEDFPPKQVDWLVDGLIPAESIVAVSGDEGVGKTSFLLAMSRSLTEGIDFLGRRVSPTPVLYLGLDVSQVTLQAYIRALRWVPNGAFRILTMWTGEDMQPPMLDNPIEMEKLYAIAEEKHPVMIFDTLRDFYEGEENSSTDTKPVLDAVRKLRAKGATPVLLVHPPKSGNSIIRGTGNISQKVDIPYLMEKDKWQGKDIVVLTCPKKNRFGSTSFRLALRQQFIPTLPGPFLLMSEIKDWKPSEGWKRKEANEEVFEYVNENPGTNQKEIQKALKMGERSIRSALEIGRDQGILRVARGERKEQRWYHVDSEESDGTADLPPKN